MACLRSFDHLKGLLLAAATVTLAASLSAPTLAQPASDEQTQCRGAKKWYAGACHYPEDITAMEAETARHQAEKARRVAEAQRQAEEEARREAEGQRQAEADAGRSDGHGEAAVAPPDGASQGPDSGSEEPASGGLSPLVWVGFAVGGTALIVAAITGGVSFDRAQSLENECTLGPTGDKCPADRQAEIDTMLTLANVSNVGFAVAGVGAVVGVIGLLISEDSPQATEDGQSATEVTIAPLIGPGFLGVTGRF